MRLKPCKTKKIQHTRNLTVLEAAGELSLHPETLREYVREGCPATKRGNSFYVSVPEVLVWMKANGRTGKQGVRPQDESPDLESVRIRKETALAEKYELQTARERGELVPVSQVQQWIIRNLQSARNHLLGLPAKAVVAMAGRDSAEQQSILEQLIRESLEVTANMATDLENGLESA